MKSYKEKLISFLRFKNEAIKAGTRHDLDLYDLSDFEEVAAWPESLCAEIWLAMTPSSQGDGGTCPWCYIHGFPVKGQCEPKGCKYGQRHGYCDDSSSRYTVVVAALEHQSFRDVMRRHYTPDVPAAIPPKVLEYCHFPF